MKNLVGVVLIVLGVLLYCLTSPDNLIAGLGAGVLFSIGSLNITIL